MMSTPLIHIVDDDDSLRTAVLRLLSASGYEARGYASTGDFLHLTSQPFLTGRTLIDCWCVRV